MFRSKPDSKPQRKRVEFVPDFQLEWKDGGWVVRELNVFGCYGMISRRYDNKFIWSYDPDEKPQVFVDKENAIRAVYHIAMEDHIKYMMEKIEGHQYV